MSQNAQDVQSMLPLWEYTFQTSDKQRKHAMRSFSELRRGRFANWAIIAIAWLVLIAAIVLTVWLCLAAVAGLQYIAQGFVSDEAIAVLAPVAACVLYIFVVRSIFQYFRNKLNNKEHVEAAASIKVFDGRFVEFIEEDSTRVRKIERFCFNRDYLFFLIDSGTRFVYIPRGLVAADTLEEIRCWATETPL